MSTHDLIKSKWMLFGKLESDSRPNVFAAVVGAQLAAGILGLVALVVLNLQEDNKPIPPGFLLDYASQSANIDKEMLLPLVLLVIPLFLWIILTMFIRLVVNRHRKPGSR